MLALLSAAALAQTVTSSGSCPGVATLTGSGFAPSTNAVVLAAPHPGQDRILGAHCFGLKTDLATPVSLARVKATPKGDLVVTIPLTAHDCGEVYQLVDLKSCRLSNVETVDVAQPLPADDEGWADAPLLDASGSDTGTADE